MSDNFENFRDAVAGSSTLKDRWNSVADAVVESAARDGISVSREDLIKLDSIRLHVLTGDADLGVNWRDEAEQKIPAFAQKAESRKLREALDSANEAEAAKAREAIMARSPSERMRLAREAGAEHAKSATTKKELTAEERAKIIAELDAAGISGSERLKRAREAGLE